MKRLLLGLFCALFLCGSAHASWWHHRGSKSNSSGAVSTHKTKKSKSHREKYSHGSVEPLYTSPKTVGWWHHKGPGPMGAGAD